MSHYRFCLLLLLSLIIAQGCDKLEARDQAEIGLTALKNCEFQAATDHFTRAHILYPEHRDILIGLAFSEAAAIASSDEINAILSKLGFKENISTICQNAVENTDDEDEMKDENTCRVFRLSQFISKPTEDATDKPDLDIDPELTWHDIHTALRHQNALLQNAAVHFQTAAIELGNDTYHIDAFGYQNIGFHQADFAASAATLHLVSAAVDILSEYTLEFGVKETIDAISNDDRETIARIVNDNLFIPNGIDSNAHNAITSIYLTFQAIALATDGIQYLRDLSETPEKFDVYSDDGCLMRRSLFRWEKLMPGIIRDLDKLSALFANSMTQMDLESFVTPPVVLDLDYLLHHLPHRNRTQQVLSIDNGEFLWSLQNEIDAVNAAFSYDIFTGGDFSTAEGVSFRANTAWLKFDFYRLL